MKFQAPGFSNRDCKSRSETESTLKRTEGNVPKRALARFLSQMPNCIRRRLLAETMIISINPTIY